MAFLKNWLLKDGSLRKQAKTALKNKHIGLFTGKVPGLKNFLFDYFTDRRNWVSVILLVVLLLAFFTFVHVDFLGFISFKEAKVLADQRTANVATIISMTLAIVGLLMSNMAIKEPLAYSVLFKQSYLYFIIYFTLTSIFLLVIISTLRDSFTQEYHYLYDRLVLAGTYLALIVLFFIGHLFRTIIKVINPVHINKSLQAELVEEARQTLRSHLFNQYCTKHYHALMKNLGIEYYSLSMAFDTAVFTKNTDKKVEFPEPETKFIYDINLTKIKKKYCNPSTGDRFHYRSLEIGKKSNEYDNFIWNSGTSNNEKQRKFLKSCVILTDKDLEEDIPTTYRNYFDQKLEDATQAGRHKEVKSILDAYLEIYDLQMQNVIDE